ncbi:MAG: discoidin domain-containing protein [Acidobacteriaceae bacterium]
MVQPSSLLHAQTVRVDITPSHEANSFDPKTSLGGGVDRIPIEAIDKDLTEGTLKQVFEAGWQPITYRQNTELAVEAWHWNPEGTWSESGDRGYFVGSINSTTPIRYSYGYALPHRGVTRNDGTGNVGYSRLTDGDEATYWKSNPYLTGRYTGEDDALHAQWIILDLASNQLVDSLKISWGEPYAKKYLVQYWNGADPIHLPTHGAWQTFAGGVIDNGAGGVAKLKLADFPMAVRFVRVFMTASSNTCGAHGAKGTPAANDPRNCVGYAMREVYLGTTSADGAFHDLLRHTADQEQTATYCSSVDPWHQADSPKSAIEAQVGFDFFYQSGVTQGLPAMMPIAMIYDTPDNAAAEIRYLEAHHYPISYVEMGEEADGQYMQPEDYGTLYLQYAAALRRVDPNLKLGGPSFEGVNQDIEVWPDAQGRSSWTGRFIDYLKQHNRMGDLQFFSFEHYPYEPCKIAWSDLYQEPELVSHIMQVWHGDGVPASLPMFITESNLSSSSTETYMDIFGGLWLADYNGSFMSAGGNAVYYFHDLPLKMERGCDDSLGTFGMFTVDADYRIQQRLSQFYASQMINREWLERDGTHQVFRAASDVDDGAGHVLVTAYAVHRPDGEWSIMMVNKDQHTSHRLRVVLADQQTGRHSYMGGPVHQATFGSEQYAWHPAERGFTAHLPIEDDKADKLYSGGHADPDGPVLNKDITAGKDTEYELPPASIMVIRGKLSPE